jgi:hypothetical protein
MLKMAVNFVLDHSFPSTYRSEYWRQSSYPLACD